MDWRQHAACARDGDPDAWFSTEPGDVAHALAVCAVCPVRAACAAAGEREDFGIWGGVVHDPRPFLNRQRLLAQRRRNSAAARQRARERAQAS